MTKTMANAMATGLLACTLIGCNLPPSQPKTAGHKLPKALTVVAGNSAEREAVLAAEEARVDYRYRLVVLQNYYSKTGNLDKHRWTERELDNLATAQTFTWEGLANIAAPQGESLENADDHLLVEYVVSARKAWLKAVQNLVAYYRETTPGSYKAQRVANVLVRFDPVRTYMYFLEAEVPPADLKPVEVVPQADEMYEKAVALHAEGKGILHIFATTSYPKQRQALGILLRMVRLYPRSTKIALAAYHIGEIYKEYFNENIRAVHWYERAWQWDANITKPARFQAATVHDIRLLNRAKAIELYRQVILHEQFNSTNVRWSHNRIRDLTGS